MFCLLPPLILTKTVAIFSWHPVILDDCFTLAVVLKELIHTVNSRISLNWKDFLSEFFVKILVYENILEPNYFCQLQA